MNEAREITIELSGIKKLYQVGTQEVAALNGIDLKIYKGEFAALMGPSGSGKSTLMNILGCLDRPTCGSYKLDGREIAHLSDDELAKTRNKKIGFVFQNFNLLSKITALDNVALPLVYAGVGMKERLERAHHYLKAVGLDDRADHKPNELSGGQRQRVAIARALVNDPSIIMADEPTGNLDSVNSHELLMTFKNLNEEEGVTIIMVSHDPMIASYSSRFVYIKDGYIAESLQRRALSQDEYFQKIVDINSLESRKLFEDHHD